MDATRDCHEDETLAEIERELPEIEPEFEGLWYDELYELNPLPCTRLGALCWRGDEEWYAPAISIGGLPVVAFDHWYTDQRQAAKESPNGLTVSLTEWMGREPGLQGEAH